MQYYINILVYINNKYPRSTSNFKAYDSINIFVKVTFLSHCHCIWKTFVHFTLYIRWWLEWATSATSGGSKLKLQHCSRGRGGWLWVPDCVLMFKFLLPVGYLPCKKKKKIQLRLQIIWKNHNYNYDHL